MALTRRRFLQWAGATGLAAAAPLGTPRVALGLPGDPAAGDALIFVFLRGGMDGLSALVPVAEPQYYARRPGIAVPQAAALALDGRFGLHPALAPLHEIYQEGDLALVPACGHPGLTRSHFTAMDRIEAGRPDGAAVASGFFTRHLASRPGAPGEVPAAAIGSSLPRSLRGSGDAVAMRDATRFELAGFPGAAAGAVEETLAALYAGGGAGAATGSALSAQAGTSLRALAAVAAADPSQYEPRNGAVYPDGGLARSLRQIAQLLRSGDDLRVELALLDAGGWDTHENMGTPGGGRMASLLAGLGSALAAFYQDLSDVRDQFTLVALAEFGRQVHENGSGGTDHGNGGVLFAMGGGVRAGVHGVWPGLEDEALADRNGVAPVNDFRDVFAEIFARRLGNPNVTAIFPGLGHTPLGVVDARF